jgi:hypothetical protein
VWWSDELVPRWVTRLLAFVVATPVAFAAGWVALLGLTWVRRDGLLLEGLVVHAPLVVALVAGAAVLVGLAAASAREDGAGLKRALAAGGLLLLLAALATVTIVVLVTVGRLGGFDAAAFRAAAVDHDHLTLEAQAQRAARGRDLIGLSPAEVRRTLGSPVHVGPRGRRWVWGSGDARDPEPVLAVRFDARRERVVEAIPLTLDAD